SPAFSSSLVASWYKDMKNRGQSTKKLPPRVTTPVPAGLPTVQPFSTFNSFRRPGFFYLSGESLISPGRLAD
ncbi:MAG: hypothetical protein KDD10_30315, partial [Phaeodactylibacter sp.]|nr:hypothetical protein [Phaeodactylibacter sp.]